MGSIPCEQRRLSGVLQALHPQRDVHEVCKGAAKVLAHVHLSGGISSDNRLAKLREVGHGEGSARAVGEGTEEMKHDSLRDRTPRGRSTGSAPGRAGPRGNQERRLESAA